MASISSPGLGSGLDIRGLVDQLVAAERVPAEFRFSRKESVLSAEISAYGALKGAVSQFSGSLSALEDISSYQKTSVSPGDRDVFSATASGSPDPANYSVEVTNLAQAHKIASGAFTNTTDSVGTGTLTFQFGTGDKDLNTFTLNPEKLTQTVTITAGDNSLEGVRDAVNNADIGVRASLVNDGTGYRLVFSSDDSGAANSLSVTVEDDDLGNTDTAGLSQFAYDPTAAVGAGENMSQTVIAQDALLEIDGIPITSESNTVKGAIEDVTLTLKTDSAGAAVSLGVARNTGHVKEMVSSFVNNYNGLMGTVKSLSGYDADTGQSGALQGDALIRSVESTLRNVLSQTVSGLSGSYQSLADIGVQSNKLGFLEVDSSTLGEALDDDFEAVARLFAVAGDTSDALIRYESSTDDSVAGNYAVNISQVATRGLYAADANSTLTVDASNDTFTIKLDGVTSEAISLTQKVYASGADLAAELQSRINADSKLDEAKVSVTVSYETDHFEISSASYGSESKVEFFAVTGSTLGLGTTGTGTSTDGLDVAGTIGGASATGFGRFLTGSGDAAGLKLEVLGGAAPLDRGNLSFTRGMSYLFDQAMQGYLGKDSLIDSRTEGLTDRIKDIGLDRQRLDRRVAQMEARYLAQFSAMDALVANLQSTGNFLQQQIDNLPGFDALQRR